MWYGLYKIPWIRWSCSKFVAFKALSTFSSKEFMAMIIICPEVMDPVLLFKVWIKSRNDLSASGWLMMSLICLAACSIAPSSRWQFFKPVKQRETNIIFRVPIKIIIQIYFKPSGNKKGPMLVGMLVFGSFFCSKQLIKFKKKD